MLEKVKKTITNRKLIRPGEHVLVAVSGGADSMALLYALYWLKRSFPSGSPSPISITGLGPTPPRTSR